jgi:hypothetical protein
MAACSDIRSDVTAAPEAATTSAAHASRPAHFEGNTAIDRREGALTASIA